MDRTRRTASAVAGITLSITALLVTSAPLAAENTSIVRDNGLVQDIHFYDNSPYSQLVRIRSLTFFTLANNGKSRWFVGVNSDGVVGLHYRAASRGNRDADADLVRLPYLDVQR